MKRLTNNKSIGSIYITLISDKVLISIYLFVTNLIKKKRKQEIFIHSLTHSLKSQLHSIAINSNSSKKRVTEIQNSS